MGAEQDMNYVLAPPKDLLRRWSTVRPFAKVEFLSTEKWPRNISPRHPHFNFVWAQYTKPLESYFYKHLSATGPLSRLNPGGKEAGVSNPYIGKGLNKLQRGDMIKYKYELFERQHGATPMVFRTDCTGLDAHMTLDFIKEENKFYRKCFPNWNKQLDDILTNVEVNRLVSDGIRGKLRGSRMSGDMHTGLGNTLVTVAMMIAFFKRHNVKRYDIFADGDDTLVFVHPSEIGLVETYLPKFFLGCGHELKIEGIAKNIFEVEWCQTKIIRCNDQYGKEHYVCVNNPNKIFATMGSHIHCRDPVSAVQFFSDVSYAYSKMYSMVPFFRELAQWRYKSDARTRRLQPGLAMDVIHNDQHLVENQYTMLDYCNAFAVTPAQFEARHSSTRSELAAAVKACLGKSQ